uniref:Helicase n=1 Tax=viral metagenome TaxID=1070528 RepID=A0A6C0E2P0_9ZZZZ
MSDNIFNQLEHNDELNNLEIINKWDDLDINTNILRGIYAFGFEDPSPIQRKAIIPIINNQDIIAQAQSGTGKTGAFSIGALSRIDLCSKTSQVLIMAPTHELSTQIAGVISGIGSMMEGLEVKLLVGGSSINNDIEYLKKSFPHVIVGCPGRVYDMIRRNYINSKTLKLVVLDEADEMLSTGFKEQVYNIFQSFNNDIQVALFSATLPPHIHAITSKFMRNPVQITVTPERLSLEGIMQYFVALENDIDKYANLKRLYSFVSMSQCIIYCNSVKRVVDLYVAMNQDDFPVCMIHSNMEKGERSLAFNEFKSGKARVLISSNVTARGIDIQQVSTVINFDLPKDVHTYIHRIGRSGRWGRKGVGINMITRRDIQKIKEIEQYYNTQINELPDTFWSAT